MLHFAVDLDGTIFDYERGLAKWLGRKVPRASDWSLAKSGWFETEEEFHAEHVRAVEEGLYETLEPYPGAVEALWKMQYAGHGIHIVTARFAGGTHTKSQIQTANSLHRWSLPYRSISFLDEKLRFKADCYIDDSPENINQFLKSGAPVIMPVQLYNQSLSKPNLYPFTDWSQVPELADKLSYAHTAIRSGSKESYHDQL